jgi:hypothetical protein
MSTYQRERADILGSDITHQVIRAMLVSIFPDGLPDGLDSQNGMDTKNEELRFSASGLATVMAVFGEEEESPPELSLPRIGRTLKRLRLKQDRTKDRTRARQWVIDTHDLLVLAKSYGLLSSSYP